ncbi:MAG: Mpo1-like protein [Steroidobacteraceae bacterium]
MNDKSFRSFRDFYPFYLGEHANRTCRQLHFAGTSIAVALLCAAVATQTWWLIAVALVQGYAFAWAGHFFFEHNKPATFKYPWFSLMGDWKLWWDILTGKVRI